MSWVLYIQIQNFWFLIVFRRLLSIFNSCHLTNRGSVDSATSQEKDRIDFSVYPVCLLNRLSALDRWNGDFTACTWCGISWSCIHTSLSLTGHVSFCKSLRFLFFSFFNCWDIPQYFSKFFRFSLLCLPILLQEIEVKM